MIALCASHIDSDERRDFLVRMLQSVARQTLPIKMHLSISSSLEDFPRWSESLCAFSTWLHVHTRESKMTQFQHYRALRDELVDEEQTTTWCLFTDDDDVWDPWRVEEYSKVAESTALSVVACTNGRRFNGSVCTYIGCVEYFEYAARFELLDTFFKKLDADGQVINKADSLLCCDLIWRNFLRRQPMVHFTTRRPWLYDQVVPEDRADKNIKQIHEEYMTVATSVHMALMT